MNAHESRGFSTVIYDKFALSLPGAAGAVGAEGAEWRGASAKRSSSQNWMITLGIHRSMSFRIFSHSSCVWDMEGQMKLRHCRTLCCCFTSCCIDWENDRGKPKQVNLSSCRWRRWGSVNEQRQRKKDSCRETWQRSRCSRRVKADKAWARVSSCSWAAASWWGRRRYWSMEGAAR